MATGTNSNLQGVVISLDDVVDQFNKWQNYMNDVIKSNVTQQDEIANLKKLLSTSQDHETQLQHDISSQRVLIESLQSTLGKRCDLEDENRELKKELETARESILSTKKETQREILRTEKQLKDQADQFAIESKTMQEDLKKSARVEKDLLQSQIDEKISDINSLKKQLGQLEKDHQAQLYNIRLECDTKLLKLQKQNSKIHQSSSAAVNQDIFRKKLQHAKAESEKEISGLKMTINDLKQKITMLEQKANSHYNSSSGPSLQNKKRRF